MLNLEQLMKNRQNVLRKILELENDLKRPLKMDQDANAQEEGNRETLNGIYSIEKKNLDKIDAEIKGIKSKNLI